MAALNLTPGQLDVLKAVERGDVYRSAGRAGTAFLSYRRDVDRSKGSGNVTRQVKTLAQHDPPLIRLGDQVGSRQYWTPTAWALYQLSKPGNRP